MFKNREGATLALVFPETSRYDSEDLLGSAALAAFRSLAHNLLAASEKEPYLTLGFSGGETRDEVNFAAFVVKQLGDANKKNNGKIIRYGKTGFFR